MILSASKKNLYWPSVNSSFKNGCFQTFFPGCATALISRAHPSKACTLFSQCLLLSLQNTEYSPWPLFIGLFFFIYVTFSLSAAQLSGPQQQHEEHCWQIAVFICALTSVLPRLWTVPHSSGAQSHLTHQWASSLLRATGEHTSAHRGQAEGHTEVFLWFAAQGKHLYCDNMDMPTSLVSLKSVVKMKAKCGQILEEQASKTMTAECRESL